VAGRSHQGVEAAARRQAEAELFPLRLFSWPKVPPVESAERARTEDESDADVVSAVAILEVPAEGSIRPRRKRHVAVVRPYHYFYAWAPRQIPFEVLRHVTVAITLVDVFPDIGLLHQDTRVLAGEVVFRGA